MLAFSLWCFSFEGLLTGRKSKETDSLFFPVFLTCSTFVLTLVILELLVWTVQNIVIDYSLLLCPC